MAGDWIPMRTDLWDCPKVVRILSAICPDFVRDASKAVQEKSRIIGALYRTWSIFDTYTHDGILDGYTEQTLDSMVGMQGWCANLQHVGWLIIEPQRLIMTEFDVWLSSSAKARLKDRQRKKNERSEESEKRPKSVRKNPDKNRTTGQESTGEVLEKEAAAADRSGQDIPKTDAEVIEQAKAKVSQWAMPRGCDHPKFRAVLAHWVAAAYRQHGWYDEIRWQAVIQSNAHYTPDQWFEALKESAQRGTKGLATYANGKTVASIGSPPRSRTPELTKP